MRSLHRPYVLPALAATLSLGPSVSHASGFSLLEQSASRLGTAFAGTAAAADDATTNYYNPAGLVRLEQAEATFVATGVDISSRFEDDASQAAFLQPLGGDSGDAGSWNFIPTAYFAAPVGERFAFGFGVNVPFGLKLEYEPDWLGRFQSIDAEIETVNFNPSLAWRATDRLSLGLGINYQRVQARLTNAVNYSAVVAQGVQQLVAAGQLPASQAPAVIAANAGLEGLGVVRGDDGAWGFDLGMLFDVTDHTRVGLSYRSKIKYTVEGSANFDAPTPTNPVGAAIVGSVSAPGGALANGPVSVDLELPDTALLSITHDVGDRWQVLADIGWTGWSSIQELKIVRDDGDVLSQTPEKWHDVMRYALGVTYEFSPEWTLRAGVAYDGTEVDDRWRTPRLPDPSRTWLALGARWQPLPACVIDLGYARILGDDAPMSQDNGNAAAYGIVDGAQESTLNVIGVQAAYRF